MCLLVVVLAWAALCSGQLWDELDRSGEMDLECFREDMFPCFTGGCVKRDQYCDGFADCPDGSDEDICPHRVPDPQLCNLTHQYLCVDGLKCIPNSWVCNNVTECNDGSDEANCTRPDTGLDGNTTGANFTCKGFRCDGNKCISRLWVCDGYYDCDDRSDEDLVENCRHTMSLHRLHDTSLCIEMLPREKFYRCADSTLCLTPDYMCNGIRDCRDGSDEGDFCEHWDTICGKDESPCKANTTCHPERFGAYCACPIGSSGIRYNYTSEKCEDIDECTRPRPQCSHTCVNKHGHFNCRCDPGYKTDTYVYLCYADGPEAMLFFSTETEIRYMNVKSGQEVLVATGIKNAHGVTYDGKYLYWVQTAQGHQAIQRAQLEDVENTKEVILSLGLEDPGDIAIDWIGGHIYFSDVHRGAISVCRTDGSICTTLRTNAKMPRFVTLALRFGQMYWADLNHRPVIMAARLDGSEPYVLVEHLSSYATGLAVDVPNNRLYYVDRTIKVLKLDDKQSYALFDEPYHHPYAIAVFENTVFWSDFTTNTIQTSDKLHGSDRKKNKFNVMDTPVYDMHVYHPVLFEPLPNPCGNMTCSHLCLLVSNTTATCACPDGMALSDGKTCKHIDGYRPLYLVVGGGSLFTRVDYNSLGNPESHATPFDIARVQAMAYDNTRDTLYIYDGQRKIINHINMTDFSLGITQPFLYQGLENVVDMDYDFASDTLYILDAGRHFIEAVSLRTLQRALITRFTYQEEPISMCVMPDYGRMLVAIRQTEQDDAIQIDSISLDGEDRKQLIANDLIGPKVVLRYDSLMDVVYIADEGNGIIDLIHPEGTGRDNFRRLSTTVTGIAVTDPYVFWTDRRTRLYWSNAHEATHYVRNLQFSLFPTDSHLHIQAASPPPDPKNPLLSHPCLTTHNCSHICLQTSHAPTSHKPRNTSSPLNFTCACPPGLLNLGGQCKALAICKDSEIYCHNSNVCVPDGKRCDGIPDCKEGEDEDHCQAKPKEDTNGCARGYKLCNKFCVEESQNCGTETPVTTTTNRGNIIPSAPQCSSTEVQCVNSSICIERWQMCDGQLDCLSGSDEAPAVCRAFVCQSNEFMCTVGSCVLKIFQCDGDDDCADGSDEVNCDSKTCGLGHYRCRNSECIELRKRCDGKQDCMDMSDEEDCTEPVPEEEPVPSCGDGEHACRLNKSICIPATAVCNMKTDCPGNTDEWGCDPHCAPFDRFACRQEELCVSRFRICDGTNDCHDGSDETPEACGSVNKTSLLYPPLILPALECRDGFLCPSGQCLEWWQVCNREPDCLDGSDENGLCATACINQTCPAVCHPTPSGGICRCRGDSCAAADACARSPCAQLCRSERGALHCACHRGYTLRSDRRSCKADSGDLSILYMTGNTVWSVAVDGRGSVVYNDPQNVAITDMDVDVRRHRLYVSLTEAGKLVEANTTRSDVVITNVGRPSKVAVDWVTGNVYFVDSTPSASYIRACNVERKRCAKILKLLGNNKVVSLVLDPPSGRMFYCTVRDTVSMVWSASLSGQGAAVDLSPARNCSGLAVDSFKKLLYVAETSPPRVFRVDFNGEKEQTILDAQHLPQAPHGLALFEDSIFCLTSNSFKLNRCSLFGKKECHPFIYRVIGADTFVVRHPSAQRGDVRDACEAEDCPGLCALPGVCLCEDGSRPAQGACRLLEMEQLPLFNGWTQQQYARARHAMLTAVGALLGACAVYLLVFLYYQFVHKPRQARARTYMEVRFQNATEETPAPSSTVVEVPQSSASAHEFVNPLQYVRGLWDQVRGNNRPIGTAGLDISIPYQQEDLSDTESDLDERDNKNIVRK